MHELRINNTVIHFPSEWDELTRPQLEVIAGLSLMNLQEMQFKTMLLFHLGDVKVEKEDAVRNPEDYSEILYKLKINKSSSAYLSAPQIADLANGFDFLFKRSESKDEKVSISLDSQLTKNLIPYFTVEGSTYYGPSDKLFNVIFSEFIHAETNLQRFVATKEIKYLDQLIAILYRLQDSAYDADSPDFKGDRRAPFNDHHIEARAEKIHKLNHNVKLCIFLYYTGCQWWIQNQFPDVFSKKSKGKDDGLGFLGLVDALTGGDVTKTGEVHKAYLMDVMVHLQRAAVEFQKAEEKLKKK